MQKDEHSVNDEGYRVSSLYFDDVYATAYMDKAGGFLKRKKFRIRVYNLSPDRITLEGKYKEDAYIKKKSALLTLDEYRAVLNGTLITPPASEILQDFYSQAVTANLKPAVITDYHREAFTAGAGNVRITFDRNLSAGYGAGLDIFKASYLPVGEYYDKAVLEIKYDRFLPSYIQELFSGFPIMSKPVSKYLLCMNKILEVTKKC
jgi:SPX domain protein involved in polyphosphate accumulation